MKGRNVKPTPAELDILAIVWDLGRATVRDVYEVVNRRKPTAYTTVLKLMQIMHEKGLLDRNPKAKAHIYTAARPQEQTQRGLVSDLLEKAFRGSALKLVQQVLETSPSSASELAEMRRMIAEAEQKEKAG